MIMLDHLCVTQLEHPDHSGVTRKLFGRIDWKR